MAWFGLTLDRRSKIHSRLTMLLVTRWLTGQNVYRIYKVLIEKLAFSESKISFLVYVKFLLRF
jgi:hypothetical protein